MKWIIIIDRYSTLIECHASNDGSVGRLVDKIQKFGIKFEVKESNGEPEWTSLSGGALWKILVNLSFEGLFINNSQNINPDLECYIRNGGGRNELLQMVRFTTVNFISLFLVGLYFVLIIVFFLIVFDLFCINNYTLVT